MQTLSTDLAGDTLTITHVPTAPELLHADAGAELRWDDRDSDHEITVVSGTCRVLDRRLPPELAELLDADEQRALRRRARGIIRSGTFPVDESGLRYPWPLI